MTTPSRARFVPCARFALPFAVLLLCAGCQDRRDPVKPTVTQAPPAAAASASRAAL